MAITLDGSTGISVSGNNSLSIGTFTAGNTTITGTANISSTLGVAGALSTGNTTVTGTLAANVTTITGNVSVTGNTTLTGILISNAHTMTGNLSVTGASFINGVVTFANSSTNTAIFSSNGTLLLNTSVDPTYGSFQRPLLSIKQTTDHPAGFNGIHIESASYENVLGIGFNGNNFNLNTSYRANGSYRGIAIKTADTERLTISNTGNIGINLTTPYSPLTINGDTHVLSSYRIYFGANTTSAGAWQTSEYASGGIKYLNCNGFEINDYGYTGSKTFIQVSSSNKVGITVAADGTMELNTKRVRHGPSQKAIIGWWDWYQTGASGTNYLHIKTSLWGGGSPNGNSQPTMSYFHFLGYDYRAYSIDSKLGFHNWSGSIYSAVSTNNGSLNVSPAAYVSSDGYVVLRLDVSNLSYMGITVNYYQAYGYGFQPVTVSASAVSSSTTYY